MEINNNNNSNNVRRGSRGRQKVEMVKMTNESNLQVTFSKRRSGLFKKASELCTLCGVDVALVVFSPGRKVFSFGHPSVDEVVERYMKSLCLAPDQLTGAGVDFAGSGSGAGNSGAIQLIEAHRNANLRELNAQLAEVTGQLDEERKRGEEMNKMRKASQAQCWWEKPVDRLDMEQLGQLKKAMEELKKVVNLQAERIMMQASAAVNAPGPSVYALAPLPPPPQFYPAAGASGSGQQGGGNMNHMMMVPYNNNLMNPNLINMKTIGFTTNAGIVHSDPLNNNSNNNINHNLGLVVESTHGMMNMAPPLPLPPPPQQHQHQQNPQYPHHGYNNNNMGYGRGFY